MGTPNRIAQKAGGEVRYFHGDHLGSTRVVTDVCGAVVSEVKCGPFGEVLSQSGTFETPYLFTGKPLDGTGLYYFGARYYDPEVGRFTTVDPARDGFNWYEYCRGNPLRYVDLFGLAVTNLRGDDWNPEDDGNPNTYHTTTYYETEAGITEIVTSYSRRKILWWYTGFKIDSKETTILGKGFKYTDRENYVRTLVGALVYFNEEWYFENNEYGREAARALTEYLLGIRKSPMETIMGEVVGLLDATPLMALYNIIKAFAGPKPLVLAQGDTLTMNGCLGCSRTGYVNYVIVKNWDANGVLRYDYTGPIDLIS